MRTVITNVRVFDGERVLDQGTVVINDDHIGTRFRRQANVVKDA